MNSYKVRLAQLALSVLVLLSLWPGSPMGVIGTALNMHMSRVFGFAAWLVAGLLCYQAVTLRPSYTTIALATLLATTWFELLALGTGGMLGHAVSSALLRLLGAATYIVGVLALLAAAHAWTRGRATRSVLQARAVVATTVQRTLAAPPRRLAPPAPVRKVIEAPEAEYVTAEPELYEISSEPVIERPVKPPPLIKHREQPRIVRTPPKVAHGYQLPSTELLDLPPPSKPFAQRETEILAEEIVSNLASFGVLGRITGVQPGPIVTMFEFDPAVGVKTSEVEKLEKDLSREVQRTVRVVASVAGTKCIGIEVPHADADRQIVSLRDLLDDHEWPAFKADLPIVIGKKIDGAPLYADLARMPHLLIAGATGAGKSVGLNSMLASLLFKLTPKQLRLILIDPKVVEFTQFADIPHLLVPVITEVEPALIAMRWAMREMDRRYELLAGVRVKNVASYNAQASEIEQLPLIVIVVDEYADLHAVGGKEVEQTVQRIAQKARAAGIHLIIATQRPSVDVITGVIKANMPSRIAYKVAQREDSKTILGTGTQAHTLVGKGDLLAALPGSMELQRAHSAYLSDAELARLCDHLRAQGLPEYDDAVLENEYDASIARDASGESLYDRAVALVSEQGTCSISGLQRGLTIGYNKAAKLVEQMEAQGVIGPASTKAGGKREVFANNIEA